MLDGASPPSTVALAAVYTGATMARNVAITGVATLDGRLDEISGLQAKIRGNIAPDTVMNFVVPAGHVVKINSKAVLTEHIVTALPSSEKICSRYEVKLTPEMIGQVKVLTAENLYDCIELCLRKVGGKRASRSLTYRRDLHSVSSCCVTASGCRVALGAHCQPMKTWSSRRASRMSSPSPA